MIYEQPLNEQARLCLKLEYLFDQAEHHLASDSIWDTHQAIKIILEILQTIERSDLKNKFCQILNQYAYNLSQLEKSHKVDKQKLDATLKKIDLLIDSLYTNSKKIGQELRENEFLANIQHRLQTPAGTCNFNLPTYHLWLQQDKHLQHKQLTKWFSHFSQLKETIKIMLQLLRESSSFTKIEAKEGFYQSNLDPNLSYQLIRIDLSSNTNLFPEISIGRYRLAIHFFILDITGEATQMFDDITFGLACCRI